MYSVILLSGGTIAHHCPTAASSDKRFYPTRITYIRVRVVIERELTREDLDSVKPGDRRYDKLFSAYEEEGDESLHWTIKEEKDASVVRRLLSPRMLELVDMLARNRGLSVTELAEALGRSPSNVYRDLLFLKKHKLLRFENKGRKRIPLLTLRRITLQF
uniref:ArsR family transcriptional regulator n=1 Tax=Thermofilum pendens TaxID=2269 RepID=A0A7J3X5D0_THEPE